MALGCMQDRHHLQPDTERLTAAACTQWPGLFKHSLTALLQTVFRAEPQGHWHCLHQAGRLKETPEASLQPLLACGEDLSSRSHWTMWCVRS